MSDAPTKESPMKITVIIKNVYGNEVVYPVCEQAKLFARLAGTKTLTLESLSLITALGYEISTQQTEIKLAR